MKPTKKKTQPPAESSTAAAYCTGKHCPDCGKPIVESPSFSWAPYWPHYSPYTTLATVGNTIPAPTVPTSPVITLSTDSTGQKGSE